MRAAFSVAKQVRTETALAERPTSIAAAAVDVARELHGTLSRRSALLVGLGDMGLLMVDQLREAGLNQLTVTAPVDSRAESAARRLGCHYAPFAGLEAALVGADIVVTAVGLGRTVLEAPRLEAVLRQRRRRPMFIIDAALPTDVDPAVAPLDGAFVYDLADLVRLALQGRVSREAAAATAWALVEQAVAGFVRDRAGRAAVPALVSLRRHFEQARDAVLADAAGLDAGEATRLLINRLLHDPSETLRRIAAGAEGDSLAERAAAERLLARLFRLEEADGRRGEEEERS
jgi:glutamyl-tRNA reductase